MLRLLRRLGPDGLVIALEACTGPGLPTRCPWWSTWPTTPSASLSCSPGSLRTERRPRHRSWPGGSEQGGIVHLPLGRLSEREVAEMIAACSPDADAEEHSRVGRASEGVPLFVEELLASSGIPESISETVRERLAEFPDRERAVLEAAAVLGHHFDWEIQAASGQPPR